MVVLKMVVYITFVPSILNMNQKIIIVDFGSQYTQLIARTLRELQVYCEIIPYNQALPEDESIVGIILSGSPFSTLDDEAPHIDVSKLLLDFPVLGICFGAQMTAKQIGGIVEKSNKREYGRARLQIIDESNPIFKDVENGSDIWMSHADSIMNLPQEAKIIARTNDIPIAAYQYILLDQKKFVGLQFHPEVFHSAYGKQILKNFLIYDCECKQDWTASKFTESTISELKEQIGEGKVLMALSGGVDSTVAAGLIHKAIGDRLTCIFVDNGLLRYNEYEEVMNSYRGFGFNVRGVDAKEVFYKKLDGVVDPEQKRKIIGNLFIEIFDQEADQMEDVDYLGQGTIYPDVIESVSVAGPSATIKSHHNVGGLPEHMKLKLVEPLRNLFKDEVRLVGKDIGIPDEMVSRHPFPGPGLAIRILGAVSPEKVSILQQADHIYINMLREKNQYDNVWQAATILLPIKSVGVMGDERTYEYTIALRAVNSRDGMTADWAHLPYEFLAEVSNSIINNVKGVNRVVYDISSKPPATIEWE